MNSIMDYQPGIDSFGPVPTDDFGNPVVDPATQQPAAPAPQPQAAPPQDPPLAQGIPMPRVQFNIDGSPAKAAQPKGKPQIDVVPPDFKPEYNHDELQKAKTPADIFEAMKPKSKNEYMDWWEQQHGAIVQKWDQIQKATGAAPDPDRMPNRQEKFKMLLDFGLRLMQASSQTQQMGRYGQDGPVGYRQYSNSPLSAFNQALGGAIQDDIGNKQKELDDWKAQQASIQAQRQKELDSIGDRGDAIIEQNKLDASRATQVKDMAGAAKDLTPEYPKAQTRTDKQGRVWQQNLDGSWAPIPGLLQDPDTGVRGGRAGGARQSVYSLKLAEYDSRNPLPASATPEEKRQHDLAALAYASGQTRPDATLAQQARSQAQRELGSEQNYFASDHDGMPYEDAVRERAAEIYGTLSGHNTGGITGKARRVYDPTTKTFKNQ